MSTELTVNVSMTTLEIAELTGKRHDHVMRDTRIMLVELHGEGGLPIFGEVYKHHQNSVTYPMFRLPPNEVMVLITGYSIPLRASVIKRLRELEAGGGKQLPITPAEQRIRILEQMLTLEKEHLVLVSRQDTLETHPSLDVYGKIWDYRYHKSGKGKYKRYSGVHKDKGAWIWKIGMFECLKFTGTPGCVGYGYTI